jgi:hypothetical protein
MDIYRIDPFQDSRWEEFVQTHPESSLFHSRAWLQSLNATYGYEPIAFTTSPFRSSLSNGIVLCRVRSLITGSRLVSVPFADHCQPLVSHPGELKTLLAGVQEFVRSESSKYFELRCLSSTARSVDGNPELAQSISFVHHVLDLRPDLDTVFRRFHHSCVQRKIRRAEREGLLYEEGTSDASIRQFYSLLIMTRRKHGLPPQPLSWFFNLRNLWGEALKVCLVLNNGRAIAGILTIRHKQSLTYKYGASDSRFHSLGAMALLFWHAVQEGKRQQLYELDLGRSDLDDQGLITFKNHLGAKASILNYYRYPRSAAMNSTLHRNQFSSSLYSYLPSSLLRVAGRILYRHVG